MPGISESTLEKATLEWLGGLGYGTAHSAEIAPGELLAERVDYTEVLLERRLRTALERLNPGLPYEAIDAVVRKVTRLPAPTLVGNNHVFHLMLVNGIDVEYRNPDGGISYGKARLLDFVNPDNNDWLAVNQFTVLEGNRNRRPDIVVFVNGLPLAIFELKNPAKEEATVVKAYNQLQTYKHQIPSLLAYNATLVTSDGVQARIGSLTAPKERFMPWRTVEGDELAPSTELQLAVLVKGVFEKHRFLDLVRHFMVFEDEGGGELIKKQAGYHQFHAVNTAVETTVEAASPQGDKRCGVVWHTQGSGKSLTMAFYAGKIILHPKMENPTLVVLTDRNDLDEQLFGTFARCHELLRQKPVQAGDRQELKQLLQVASGGVVFTTIQKFFPEQKGETYPCLSERRNIVVIADEAHRSQYDFIDGFARHMRDALPNASFIGFTGTPIELTDKNTRAVFGDYIHIYDIHQAVEDKATVPIYYESRLARLALDENERPRLDEDFEEATEGEERSKKEKLKTKWAALEALVGAEKRVNLIAKDLIEHFEDRLTDIEGKAMVVCMSRRICVELYDALCRLRPEWHDKDNTRGAIKVVMTGQSSSSRGCSRGRCGRARRRTSCNRGRSLRCSKRPCARTRTAPSRPPRSSRNSSHSPRNSVPLTSAGRTWDSMRTKSPSMTPWRSTTAP